MAPSGLQKSVRKLLAGVLFIEFVGGVVLLARMLPTFPKAGPQQSVELPLWISLVICLVVAAIWVGATAVGALRATGTWVRGSTVTIHVLMIAAGTGVRQGILGDPRFGTWLIVLGVLGVVFAVIWKPKGNTDSSATVSAGDRGSDTEGLVR